MPTHPRSLTPALLRRAERHLREVEPRFIPVLQRVGPCTLEPSRQAPFAALVRAIVSQQLSNKAADSIERRVYALFDDGLDPAQFAALPEEALRGAGLSRGKVHYLHTLSRAVAAGELDLDALAKYDDETMIRTLVSYPGIGRWTAEMFLIFALGRPDVLAVDDLGLRRGAQVLLELPQRPTPKQLGPLAEAWRPYRSVASWYLWRG